MESVVDFLASNLYFQRTPSVFPVIPTFFGKEASVFRETDYFFLALFSLLPNHLQVLLVQIQVARLKFQRSIHFLVIVRFSTKNYKGVISAVG